VLDYVDGVFIDRDTGEVVQMEEPAPNDTLPDWLWDQHHGKASA
jgi:hypothetical protein